MLNCTPLAAAARQYHGNCCVICLRQVRAAADAGDVLAQLQVASLLEKGEGVKQEFGLGFRSRSF
jgi:TPR repeat protein